MLVDTVNGESVEHIERSHPLGVALGQIVVDGDHVYAVACQGIEEDGQRSYERLTLTRCHLGYLTLVEHLTTEELHVVVHHFPLQVVAAGCPVVVVVGFVAIDADEVVARVASQLAVEVSGCHHSLFVLGETACRLLNDAESHRHHLVECFLIDFEYFLVNLVYLVEDSLTLVDRCFFNLSFELFYLSLLLFGRILHIRLDLFCLGAQLVVVESLNLWVSLLNLLHKRLDELHVACRLVSEQ